MEYLSQPNLLLEALTCCGRRSTGRNWEETEQRILQRKAETDKTFDAAFTDMKSLNDLLARETRFDESEDDDLFRSIAGLPANLLGLCSPAFLLFYPLLGEFDGDLAAFSARIEALSPSQVAKNILDLVLSSGQGPEKQNTFTPPPEQNFRGFPCICC